MLVAIAIPVFTRQLEKSRESTDLANVRSAYAELVTAYLTDGGEQSAYVEAKQTQNGWQSSNRSDGKMFIGTDITTSGVSGSSSGDTTAALDVECATKTGTNKYYKVHIATNGDITVKAVANTNS